MDERTDGWTHRRRLLHLLASQAVGQPAHRGWTCTQWVLWRAGGSQQAYYPASCSTAYFAAPCPLLMHMQPSCSSQSR
eukprot:359404-Chlamydomonas_euryale.AAC.1